MLKNFWILWTEHEKHKRQNRIKKSASTEDLCRLSAPIQLEKKVGEKLGSGQVLQRQMQK